MTGGLVAGLVLSAVMLLGEALSGQPSALIELERKTATKRGVKTLPDQRACDDLRAVGHPWRAPRARGPCRPCLRDRDR